MHTRACGGSGTHSSSSRARTILTFDTETEKGPEFKTLPGCLHHLICTEGLLPVTLGQWAIFPGKVATTAADACVPPAGRAGRAGG